MIIRPKLPRHAAWLALLPFAMVACDQGSPAGDPFEPPEPSNQIAHGGDVGSDPSFVFVEPIVKNAAIPDTFNPDLAPRIEICKIANPGKEDTAWYCADSLLREFGPDQIVVNVDRYEVEWKLDDPLGPVEMHSSYRITVLLGDRFLGHADIVVGDNMKDAKNLAGGDIIPVNDDRTLVIAFHAGNVGCEIGNDCYAGAVPVTGGLVVTEDSQALALFPDGWYDPGTYGDDVHVFIEARSYGPENPCIPQSYGTFLQGGLCYEYTTEPDVGDFTSPVVIAQCQDDDVYNSPLNDIYQLAAWDANENLRILPNTAEPPNVLQCVNNAPTAFFDGGVLGTLERHARALFLPNVAWAADAGLGATIGSFSTVGWMAPIYGEEWPSGSLTRTVSPGSSFSVESFVWTEHGHMISDGNGGWYPTSAALPRDGVDVTFVLVDGSGDEVERQTVTTTTINSVEGIASATFTLPQDATVDHYVHATDPLVNGPVVYTITLPSVVQ